MAESVQMCAQGRAGRADHAWSPRPRPCTCSLWGTVCAAGLGRDWVRPPPCDTAFRRLAGLKVGDEVLEVSSRVAASLSSAALRDFLSQPSLGLLVRTRPELEGGALLLGSPPHRADGPAEPGHSPFAFLAGSPGKATCGAGCHDGPALRAWGAVWGRGWRRAWSWGTVCPLPAPWGLLLRRTMEEAAARAAGRDRDTESRSHGGAGLSRPLPSTLHCPRLTVHVPPQPRPLLSDRTRRPSGWGSDLLLVLFFLF